MKIVVLALAALALMGAHAEAQTQEAGTTLDDVVVTARRSGAPMWTVTRGDSTLILVGAITGLPRDLDWRPGALDQAAARSQLILFPQQGQASVTDVFRLIWRIRTISRMPEGQTTADYLDPADQARLEALMAGERNDRWRSQSLLLTAIDLMRDKAGYTGRGGADDADDVIRGAGRKAKVPMRPVGIVRGDDLVESLITAPQSEHVACARAAIAAAEAGAGATRARAEAWRAFRVAEVVASPVDEALNECWPWGDPDIAPQLRQQWAAATGTAMVSPGVTMGVAPIRLLAEAGGVLDGLEAQGYEIDGPPWKAEP